MFNLVIGLLCLSQALSAPVGTAGQIGLLLIGVLNILFGLRIVKRRRQ